LPVIRNYNMTPDMSIWQEVLYVFLFLLATGILACFVSYSVVQWVCKVMDIDCDNEEADKKTKREIDETSE